MNPKPHIQVISERLPWREQMTLCVAAECQKPKRWTKLIVFATDFQVEGEIARAEIGRKIALTSAEYYPMLMAGTQTRALELANQISNVVSELVPPMDKESLPIT